MGKIKLTSWDSPTKVPHVRAVALDCDKMKQLIMSRLHWTELQYNTAHFEAGCAFVAHICCLLPEREWSLVLKGKQFWGWWKNQYLSMDTAAYHAFLLTESSYMNIITKDIRHNEFAIASFWNKYSSLLADGREQDRRYTHDTGENYSSRRAA